VNEIAESNEPTNSVNNGIFDINKIKNSKNEISIKSSSDKDLVDGMFK